MCSTTNTTNFNRVYQPRKSVFFFEISAYCDNVLMILRSYNFLKNVGGLEI